MSRHATQLWLTVRDLMRALGVEHCRPFHRDRLFVAAIVAGCGFWVLLLWLLPLQPITLRQAGSWRFLSLMAVQPCLEEAVFRGCLQGQLLRLSWGQNAWRGFTMANGIAAVLFVAGHLMNHPTLWAVAVMLPALTFGFFRDRYDSIWPAIALHMFYNTGYFVVTGLPRTPSVSTAH